MSFVKKKLNIAISTILFDVVLIDILFCVSENMKKTGNTSLFNYKETGLKLIVKVTIVQYRGFGSQIKMQVFLNAL